MGTLSAPLFWRKIANFAIGYLIRLPSAKVKMSMIEQDEGETFTIDSPQTIPFKDLRDKAVKQMFM